MRFSPKIGSLLSKIPFIRQSTEERFQKILSERRSIAVDLDNEYGRLSEAYNDGRINTSQHNYYSAHPQFLSWYYIAIRSAWRCWSLQYHMDKNPSKPCRISQSDGESAGPLQSVPSIIYDLGPLRSTRSMMEAASRDRSRLTRDLRDERRVFRPTRDWWSEVGVESDDLLRRAVAKHGADASNLALFGPAVPAVELCYMTQGSKKPVSYLGPDDIEFACGGLVSDPRGTGYDCIVITDRIASLGMESPENGREDADLEKLKQLAAKLSPTGILILVLPSASIDDTILGIGRIYGPERRSRLFQGFTLVAEYQSTDAKSAPESFGINVYVLRKNET